MRNPTRLAAILSIALIGPVLAQQPPTPVVRVASVERTEIAPTVAVPGTIYSRNELQVTAGVAGQLTMVAEPGTLVRKDQVVARIDKSTMQLLRAEQEALLKRARINVRQLESQLRRQQELQGANLVSEFALEQSAASKDLAISDADIIRVRIRQIDDQIRRADMLAPFTGIVINRMHRAGEDVARGEILAQMTDTRNMEVRAFVPLKHLSRTAVGDSIDIFVADARFQGRIRVLVPTGDVRSQTFEARIDLPDAAVSSWTIGQLVSVAIPIRQRELALVIPRDALVLRRNGAYVFRISTENKAEQIQVEIGDSAGEFISVSGLLSVGDRVAIRGAENLREGTDVKIVASNSAPQAKNSEP